MVCIGIQPYGKENFGLGDIGETRNRQPRKETKLAVGDMMTTPWWRSAGPMVNIWWLIGGDLVAHGVLVS